MKSMTGIPKILEIACFSLKAAQIAQAAGAQRIEFCTDYRSGGITPAIENFIAVRKLLKIPVFVMIRQGAGDFNYHQEDIYHMTKSIAQLKSLGADGFVFGALDPQMKLHTSICEKLIQAASPLPCTLHRAFDQITDKIEAIDTAAKLGFTRILTSGGLGNCMDNMVDLDIIARYTKDHIRIVAGGGIRSIHLYDLLRIQDIHEFHSSAILNTENELPSEIEIMKMINILNA
jgi:copper homeostasis protein